DGLTIDDIKHLCDEDIIMKVRSSLDNYQPKSVRRVFIPKSGSDKMRPLGIPCIWDRLVQQCILQVLEPICEPKFHNHSYGFRANRSAHHALGRVTSLINISKYHYCVDVDIKGFFDNVNHGKLLKQIWTLGIRDKRLICIISKMLKAEIDGEGVPEKGTPQGGLLSPLLSLIVLNELDWWVSSQWETFQPKHRNKNGWFQYAKKHTRLKSGFIVRYADDFKIMCSTYEEAQRFYHSTVDFLNKRLKLEISPEKSKVVNLKKNSSDFLGFKIKVIPKGKTKHGYVAKTDMNQKALKKAKTNLKLKVKDIVRHTTTFQIARYNLAVMGMQNYYCVATNIYNNLTEVSYALLPTTRVRFKKIAKLIPFETTSQDFQMKTTGIRPQTKIIMIADTPLLPINGVKHKNPLNFSQDICNFTEHGRSKIHEEIALVTKGEIRILLEYKDTTKSVEFNDNRISVFIAQQGNCYITNRRHSPTDMVCIYKNITETDRDKYQNLVFVEIPISKAILTESVEQAKMWLMNYGLSSQQKKKLNKIRANYGYQAIK
ncbi:TPA: group II intron reverse transcriptase/maturase, partial [Clostridioides difficile]|nr:group II intron reverse transcriptase/maturase [Clostridioides difficile]